MRLIGLMCVWSAEDLILPALKQASEMCDETFVNISCHAENLKKFEDNTYSLAKDFCSKTANVSLVNFPHIKASNHSQVKAEILNSMLHCSNYFNINDWVFILDVDEFYHSENIKELRKHINDLPFNQLWFESKYFFINSKHYLISEHDRLFKVQKENLDSKKRFFPTQRWYANAPKIGVIPHQEGMYHYGTATNPHVKLEFWKTEYSYKLQSNKVNWLDKIYRYYDLNDQDQWNKANRELSGIYSPWFADNFKTDNGKLFKYDGKHPKYVQNTFITEAEDYREYYNFK